MGEKNWPKSAKKCQKEPKRAKIRFPGSGAPACVLARRASRRRDEGAGPKGPRRRRLGCRPKAGKLVYVKSGNHSKVDSLDIIIMSTVPI